MGGKTSRRKGAEFERHIRRWFSPGPDKGFFLSLLTHGHLGESEEDMVALVSAVDKSGEPRFVQLSIECKNHTRLDLPGWWRQAVTQARKRGGHAVLIHKRHGSADPAEQWVTMSLEEWTGLLQEVAG